MEHESDKILLSRTYFHLKHLLTSYLWCFALFFFILSVSGVFHPYKRSFLCGDESINKPYRGDSVTLLILIITILLCPSLVFFITERFLNKYGVRDWRSVTRHFLCGILYVLTITELLKVSVSELRPHFLHSCRPDVKCVTGIVSSYNCTENIPWWLKRDMHKSFPSGHAALSLYTLTFLYFYTKKRIENKPSRISILLFYFLLSINFCITRITDNRHFWWDVLFGAILGVIIGSIMITCMRPPEESKKRNVNTAL